MTTVYSIRKPTTMPLTTGSLHMGGNANSFGRQKQQQLLHSSKPHTIQSGGMLTSYTPLPPSPPHKHKHPQGSIGASSLDSTLSTNSRDVIVGDQWLVLSKIGEGSFGEVFEVQDIDTHRRYAIKREPLDAHPAQLKHESVMYDTLAGGRGIPQCQWYGEHDDFACIVIDLLGPSLRDLSEAVSFISLEIAVQLGCQMISILEDIHSRGVVYRDVKPDNFLFSAQFHLPEFGEMYDHQVPSNTMHASHSPKPSCQDLFETWSITNNNNNNNKWSSSSSSSVRVPKLSVVDFGLATWWRNPATSKPYSQMKKRIKNKTGTARYASLNVHRGKIHTRRDDIESLGYLILDLVLGSLPWTGIQARNYKAGWERMKELKEETSLNDLCSGLPRGFLQFIEYARSLRFSDEPDYDYLRQLMRDSLDHNSDMSRLVRPLGNTVAPEEKQQQRFVPSTPYYHSNHQNYHSNQFQPKQQQCNTTGNYNTRRNSNKRRPSIKTNHFSKLNNNHHGKTGTSPVYNQEGVFMMDDLAQELPIVGEHHHHHHQQQQQNQQEQQQRVNGTGRKRRNSSRKLTISKGSNNNFSSYNGNNNNNNGRQQQQNHQHHAHHESPPRRNNNSNKPNAPPSPPTASSFQKFIENQNQNHNNNNNNRRKRGVGWNTHKHHHHYHHHQNQNQNHQHQHPYQNHHYHHPPPSDATIHVKEPSWGEDKQDALWSHYQNWL